MSSTLDTSKASPEGHQLVENMDSSGFDESQSQYDDSILALTPEDLLDVVNSYESRHRTAEASTSKVKREVSRLARRALRSDSRLSRVERECVRGYIKVEGKSVPPRVRGENLMKIVIDLILDMFGIRVMKGDIVEVRRLSLKRRSPILIK